MKLRKHFKIAIGSAIVGVFGVLFGWLIFPTVLKSQLKKEMALSKKTDARKMWEKVPFALDFKVYLFNYTNVDEIHKGGVPIVKEVGPYYFEEWKEKVDIVDNDEDDTVTYKKLDTFYFKKDKSGPGLTGDEIITLPHAFILSLVTIISRDKPAMLNMAGKALNGIFDNPPNMFLKARALDVLFDGININCARTEFAPKAVCTALKKEAGNQLKILENNQFLFSFFGMKNHTVDSHVVKVSRGMKNVMDVAKVLEIDGKPQMDKFRDKCDLFDGTDGTKFPPFMTNQPVASFSTDTCRTFKPWYQKQSSYQGIKTLRYISNIGDYANDPELNCFCDTPDSCPKKGFMDATKCLSAPLYVTLPHLLDCDPEEQKNVKGLSPDVEAHGIAIDFEPITGTPMTARQRVQFNLRLIKTDKIEQCKELPDTIAPLFWIEEGYALDRDFVKLLKHQLFLPKRIVGVVRWLLVSIGILGTFGSLVFHFKDRIIQFAIPSNATSVTKIKPEEENKKQISVIGNTQDATELAKIDM
uniref:Sensory neuron membrane protein n=1 Tax=Histia rhodope TaxID=1453155 RepID=A0A7G4KBY2_9NEOP|nr:sensory neuron membrane protein [Histia rhodope]